jgi:hypothetical protein
MSNFTANITRAIEIDNATKAGKTITNTTADRVMVSRAFISLLSCQVCCVKDATSKEILKVANHDNPCGTSNGWCSVDFSDKVQCDDHEDRHHLIVSC